MILPYNRVVKDLNGYTKDAFLAKISGIFEVRKVGNEPSKPTKKGTFGMFLDGKWYSLAASEKMLAITDPDLAYRKSLEEKFQGASQGADVRKVPAEIRPRV